MQLEADAREALPYVRSTVLSYLNLEIALSNAH